MRHKRPPKREPSPFWSVSPELIEDGGGGADREPIARERVSRNPVRPGRTAEGDAGVDVEQVARTYHGTADGEVGPGRRPPADGNEWASAALEEGEDGGLHRVGGHRRIRMELIAIGIGAAFVVGALAKPWAGSTPPPATPPSAAPSDAIAAATSAGASTIAVASPSPSAPLDADGDHDGTPAGLGSWTIATAPPWLRSPSPGRVIIVDWTSLVPGDAHRAWGAAIATLSDGALRPQGSYLLAPAVTWTAGTPSGGTALQRPASGRVLALAITWPSSVHATAVTFEYLGPDPSFKAGQGDAPFTALRLTDALVSPAGANLTQTLSAGAYWLPPSSAGPGAELAQPNAALTAGWPSGDYVVRVVAAAHTFVLRLQLAGG